MGDFFANDFGHKLAHPQLAKLGVAGGAKQPSLAGERYAEPDFDRHIESGDGVRIYNLT